MRVFISWSGEQSKLFALRVEEFLNTLFEPALKPWMSARMEAGAQWFQAIAEELHGAEYGVICVTRENKDKPWLLFEAGACAKHLAGARGAQTRVCPYLLDLDPNDLLGPLYHLNAKRAQSREGTWALIRTLRDLADGPDLKTLEKRFEAHFSRYQADLEAIVAGATLRERRAVRDLSEQDIEVLARRAVEPLEARIDTLRDRISGLVPFSENSVFGERHQHFLHEKQAIAKRVVKEFETDARLQTPVRLILDSGTSVFPLFGLLMERKATSLAGRFQILTNNIPGVLVALRDGKIKDSDPHSDLAYGTRVVRGKPTAAYWAVMPDDPVAEIDNWMSEPRNASEMTVAVTTGNYANADGTELFVRGVGHYEFKKALLERASRVYVLLPLGKILNAKLSDLQQIDSTYRALPVPNDGRTQVFFITTTRGDGMRLHAHSKFVHGRLADLERSSQGRISALFVEDFDVSSAWGFHAEKQEEIEIPHERHREQIKRWLHWPGAEPPPATLVTNASGPDENPTRVP